MPVIMAGMDHRTVWRFPGAVLGQGFLHARCCVQSGVLVQTVQYTVWRFRSFCSSRLSTLPIDAQWQFLMVQTIQQTTEIPHLLFDGRCPRYAGVQSLWCCRGEDLGAPTVAARTLSTTSYLAVTCSVFAFIVQDSGLFWVLTSEKVPVFSAYWFNTGYMSTSVYGGFWYFFTYFLRQGGPRIPVLCNAWFDSGYMLCVSFETFWPMSLLCSSCRFSWVPSWRRQSSFDGCIRREISCDGQLINVLMS